VKPFWLIEVSFLAKDLSLLRRLAIYPDNHPTKHTVVLLRMLGCNYAQEVVCSILASKSPGFLQSTAFRKPLATPETFSPKRLDSRSLPRHF